MKHRSMGERKVIMSKETREARREQRKEKKAAKNKENTTNFTDEFVGKISPKKMGVVAGLSVLIYLGELALSIIKED